MPSSAKCHISRLAWMSHTMRAERDRKMNLVCGCTCPELSGVCEGNEKDEEGKEKEGEEEG